MISGGQFRYMESSLSGTNLLASPSAFPACSHFNVGAKVGWAGQFNFDFPCSLIVSAFWTARGGGVTAGSLPLALFVPLEVPVSHSRISWFLSPASRKIYPES